MMWLHYSIFLLLPLGAGLMRGVYVTVRVTISLTCRTLGLADFGDLTSKYLPLLLKSQSKGDRALRALKGERMVEVALKGDSDPVKAGDWGILRRPSRPVEGAEAGKTK
jgi:hypothetical protein